MPTNNILPFCPTDTGTNLLTQIAYAATTDRTSGQKPGVAVSALNNKALRQSAFMSSQLAQYICDRIGADVLDDGDTATLLTNIKRAYSGTLTGITASKTANYTILNTDDYVSGDATSGIFTFTLPSAAANIGKIFVMQKTDATYTQITIARAGSDLIQGATSLTLATQWELYALQAVASGVWIVVQHSYPQALVAESGASWSGLGTVTGPFYFSARRADSYYFRGRAISGTAAASTLSLNLPSGLAIDFNKLGTASQTVGSILGIAGAGAVDCFPTTSRGPYPTFVDGSTANAIFAAISVTNATTMLKGNGNQIIGTGHGINIEFSVPIVGWTA